MPPFPEEPRATGWDDLTVVVIERVADDKGVDPRDLDPLHEVIDPDALNALFSDDDHTVRKVVFRYQGYDVTVESDGRVRLDADA